MWGSLRLVPITIISGHPYIDFRLNVYRIVFIMAQHVSRFETNSTTLLSHQKQASVFSNIVARAEQKIAIQHAPQSMTSHANERAKDLMVSITSRES